MRLTLAAVAAALLCSAGRAANSTWLSYAGRIAKSTPAQCPGGGIPHQRLLMNELYDAGSAGLDISATPAMETQTFACGYTGADSAAGVFHDWVGPQSFGNHPSVYGEGTAKSPFFGTNGGVPQNVTGGLAGHAAAIERAVNMTLPEDYSGVLGLDYEGWQPVWDGFLFDGYKNLSMELVLEQHPSWRSNMTKVEEEAQAQFEAGSKAFYLTTVRTIKALRPNAIIGLYEMPGHLWHCYWNPEYRKEQQAHNDAMDWLFAEVDITMPTIYLKGDRHPSPYCPNNASIVRCLMEEAQRLADVQNGKAGPLPAPIDVPGVPSRAAPPVRPMQTVPWAWMRADDDWLNGADLEAEFAVPFEYPSTSAVAVWGDPDVGHVGYPALKAYYEATFRPFAQQLMGKQCACSQAQCSGNGRCVKNNTVCECAPGFSGSDCSKTDAAEVREQSPRKPRLRGDAASGLAAPLHDGSTPPSGSVVCSDGMAYCGAGSTCAQVTTGMWACCPTESAEICGDFQHCCPSGTKCDHKRGVCYAA